MANEITLNTVKGKNVLTGEEQECDLDEIRCNGARIGFVTHAEGSGVRFLRILSEPTRQEVISKVQLLRAEQGKKPIGNLSSMPPSPEKMREAIRQLEAEENEDEDDE